MIRQKIGLAAEKLRSIPQGAKASFAFFAASIVTKGIIYITMPVYTRLLSPDIFGKVNVYATWEHVIGIVAMFCLSYGVFNNGMVDYPDRRDEYSFSMLVLSNIITLICSLLLLCFYPLLSSIIGLDLPLIILMCVMFMVQPAYNFWTAHQRYELKYKAVVAWTIVSAIASTLIAVIAIASVNSGRLYARLFGAEVTLIVIYIGFYIYLGIKSSFRVNTRFWRAAIIFNLPLIPHYLSMYLLGSSDKLMISWLIGDAETAYYSVAYSVAAVVTIVWTAVNSSLIPYTYEKCKKKEYGAVSAVTMPILTMFAAVSVLVIMLAPEVVAIMATDDYRESIYVIPPIVGGVFFQVQYYIYANIVYYYKKPKYVTIASVTATVLNIGLNYIFIPMYGYIAAGYTTIFCYFVQVCIDYAAMRHVVREKVYNMKYIGALSLFVVVIALGSNLIYDFAIVRYALVAAILIAAVVFRKKIISMFGDLLKKKAGA